MAEDIGGVWRTVGGRRIFIKDGEDLSTAMKNSGKFNNDTENKSKETLANKYGEFEDYEVSLTNKNKTPFALSNEFKNANEFKQKIIETMKNSNDINDLEKVVNENLKYGKDWKIEKVSDDERNPVKFRENYIGKRKESVILYKISGDDGFGNYKVLKLKGVNGSK